MRVRGTSNPVLRRHGTFLSGSWVRKPGRSHSSLPHRRTRSRRSRSRHITATSPFARRAPSPWCEEHTRIFGRWATAWSHGAEHISICPTVFLIATALREERRTGFVSTSTSARSVTRLCGGIGKGGKGKSTGWPCTASTCRSPWSDKWGRGSGCGSLSASLETAFRRFLSDLHSCHGTGWGISIAMRDRSRRTGSTVRKNSRRRSSAG